MSTLFLRNSENKTIVDIEIYSKLSDCESSACIELSVVINIKAYTEFLLENLDRAEEVAKDFYYLNELRGWLWENELHNSNHFKPEQREELALKKHDIIEEVTFLLKQYSGKYKLRVVTG